MHDHFTQRPSLSTLSPIRAVRNDPFISTTFQTYTPPGSVLQSINRSQTTKFWNEDATPSRSTTQPYFQPLFPPSPTHSRQTNKENGTSIGSGYSPGKRKGRSDTVTSSSSTAAKRHKPSPSLPFDEKLKHFRNLLADWDLTLLQVRLGSSDTNVSGEEKLGAIRDFISEVGMTWSEVQQKMYEAPLAEEKLAWTPSDRARYRSRAAAMAKFLQGRTKWTVSHLLRSWIRHPYGRAHRTSEEMYSSEEQHPYTDIRPVRPALTSFAVQIVTQHLVQSAEKAVHPSAGLHVHIPSKHHPEKRHASNIDWYNLGSHTFSTVSNIHRQYQPLLRYLISRVASRLPFIPSHNGPQDKVTHVEGYRPLNVVVDDVVSKLAFSRSKFARLPAFLTGLFHFASNASNSRLARAASCAH